ncbi:MAG: sigma-54-dependent Fis family transcriptional regulator [Paracoccaceae bacterium]|jgi:transcriptional regulator of acetoin/glycerol metabolism|nr:sigma-54-dependent Fis family transcriptional regulator [Paracoccaceae bacterium]
MDIRGNSIDRARSYLETKGKIPSGALPSVIAESWHLSLKSGIDPFEGVGDYVLNAKEFSDQTTQYSRLINYSRPELETLYDQIAGSNFVIALGSPDGVVLDTLADTQFGYSNAGKAVIPASVWTEKLRGTNALGTCLRTQKPVQVYGGEHYLRVHSDVSCICAPIFDGKGNLAGLLDASCRSTIRQQHTAALVQMSAGNIENSLIRNSHDDCIIIQFHPRQEYLTTLSAGLLVLDHSFHIVAANRKGNAFISSSQAVIGKHFDELFDSRIEDLIQHLAYGEVLRIRDHMGSAVSIRCVANKAAFALARSKVSVEDLPRQEPKIRAKNHFRDVVLKDAYIGSQLSKVSASINEKPVIHISGPAGSGKSLIARMIHASSERSGEFLNIDCAMLNETNAQTVLFGEGRDTSGILERAKFGTLHLDNVSDLPKSAQPIIKHLLTQQEVLNPSTFKTELTDILVISSSSTPIAQGQFIDGLHLLLTGIEVKMPPAKDRTDLQDILETILAYKTPDLTFAEDALSLLLKHHWPGNFHEVRKVVESLARVCESEIKGSDVIACGITQDTETGPRNVCKSCVGTSWKEELCRAVQKVVAENDGNVSEAARQLGMSRTTIYKHLH